MKKIFLVLVVTIFLAIIQVYAQNNTNTTDQNKQTENGKPKNSEETAVSRVFRLLVLVGSIGIVLSIYRRKL